MANRMESKTGLGSVRGLGSAESGTEHFWQQRLTAVGNVLLISWFFLSLLRLPNLQYETVIGWMSSPLVAVGLLLMVGNVFWHLRLGLQVVIEDYVHTDANKLGALILVNFYAIGGAALALFCILKISFGGSAA